MIVRKTALEEARRVNELFAICFEMPYTNCPADPEKDDATHWAQNGRHRGRRDPAPVPPPGRYPGVFSKSPAGYVRFRV
mgnify:CR=1 FL=1